MKTFNILLITLLTVFYSNSYAQEKIYKFSDELYNYQGVYDSKLYSENQLNNTYKLLKGYTYLNESSHKSLDSSYNELLNQYTKKEIVNNEFFKSLQDSIVQYLNLSYQIKKIRLDALNGKPDRVLEVYQDDPEVKYYSEALTSLTREDLLNAYEYLTKKQMENNSAPQALWDEYQRNIKALGSERLAFEKILNYGWYNAVNHQLPHISFDGRQEKEFRKLFKEIKTVN